MGLTRSGASLAEIERVYRTRFHEFRRVAAAIVGDGETAADAVQEAFAGVVAKRKSFAGQGSVDAWVWRVVVNTALNRRRHDRRPEALEHVSRNGHAPDEGPDTTVQARLAALPERQRLVLFLRYYADLDYAAIAEALGTSVGTVSSTLHGAHTTLRRQLEEVPR